MSTNYDFLIIVIIAAYFGFLGSIIGNAFIEALAALVRSTSRYFKNRKAEK